MKSTKLNVMVKVSILSVFAFLLMYFEIPLPIFPNFLQLDISDLPALIGAFALGPVQGVLIELMKNILHGIFKGGTAFIGEFANFAVGSIMVYTAGAVYQRNRTKKTAIVGLILGTIFMSVVAVIINLFIVLPLYEKVLNFPVKAVVGLAGKVNPKITDMNSFLVWAIVPFNLLKGVFVSILTMAVYKSVSPVIHKEIIESTEPAQNKI
jgi:riboflavin transporter FmnP